MNVGIVSSIIGAIVRALPADLLKTSVGKFVEHLKTEIINSQNKWDDSLIPLLDALEKQIGYVPPPAIARETGTL